MQKDGIVKLFWANFLDAASFGITSGGVMQYPKRKSESTYILDAVSFVFISLVFAVMFYLLKQNSKSTSKENGLAPYLDRSESGRVGKIETFSHYVARQLGFKDESECPELMKLAYEYLNGSKEFDDKMCEYLGKEANAEELYEKLVEEFERCILGYFSFHWSQVPLMIALVLSVSSDQKKLKKTDFKQSEQRLMETRSSCNVVKRFAGWANPENRSSSSTSGLPLTRANTTRKGEKNFNTEIMSYGTFPTTVDGRKQRFEIISENLKLTRISTLVEEMKVIGTTSNKELNQSEVMGPVGQSERSPVLLLIGGGMGAGKSIVLKYIMEELFLSRAIADAVVVEADAFKETDAIYRARSSWGHHQGMLQNAELVQQSSTDDASSLLVTVLTALNEGRDVIMDGTLSWIPFVEQTICMTRNVHKHRYRMGEGYRLSEDGTVTENYWQQIEGEVAEIRKPYRIELVGFVCDANLAVVRGIRKAIQMGGRAVKVKSLLKSHKRFASAFPKYYHLVDNVRLYCTNAPGGPPRLIAWKDKDSNLLDNSDGMKCFNSISGLNGDAETVYELYKESGYITQSGSVWKDIVLLPERGSRQLELKTAIKRWRQ